MAALATLIWADRAASAVNGLSALEGRPVVLMVPTPDTALRDEARGLVRTALRSFLAPLAGCEPALLPLHAEPGAAPRLDLPGLPVRLSISHEAGLSLAAVRAGGRIGVDLMRAAGAALPDWQALAHDYLGPEAAARLLGLDARERPPAFARAWTRHEAALKCLGLQLQEWSPDLARQLAPCRSGELALPAGYIGAVALCG
jgi:4'-phosphopantetheinyl transferase